jgi:antagonist of KipI
MSFLRVLKPGLQTTVQDLGRWGFQAFGVTVAGPMDPASHRIANAMVGNPRDAATLEVTLVGPEVELEDERVVAVAGADFQLTVDGEPQTAPAFRVPAGSRLAFGTRRFGSRAYLAIEGGVASPPIFGSRATHVPSRIGGIEGRRLVVGDRLPLGAKRTAFAAAGVGRTAIRPRFAERVAIETDVTTGASRLHGRVRVLEGPDRGRFDTGAIDVLQAGPYVVTPESNRMGYRLDGALLRDLSGASMISAATPIGALQVPPSANPILLMADRQTTGGYPHIATVISADIGVAGQLGPGDSISFEMIGLREAVAALAAQERDLTAVEAPTR